MCSRIERIARALLLPVRDERGQSSVEAAFALPIVLVLVLLLVQPGIILYDRIVMQAAAAEGCRLLATTNDTDMVEDFLRRRLSAVPEQDLFHIHGSECAWQIDLQGQEKAANAGVTIRNEMQPVPLIDAGLRLLGLTNDDGNVEIEVQAKQPTQPDWVAVTGIAPSRWVNEWEE